MKKPPLATPLLAFGAHPDDIEFGCGGVIARETQAARKAHFVVCSRGEAATRGTPAGRMAEAKKSAALLGATVEFVELDGDAHLEAKPAHAVSLAGIIRRHRPAIVLAPTLVGNQHPDHSRLGEIVRDAARLARYGGVRELRSWPAHAIGALYYYALAPEFEPAGAVPLLIDISAPSVMDAWRAAMQAHASQAAVRPYAEVQLARARLYGLRAGTEHALPLFPNDPPVFDSLDSLSRSARYF